MWFNIFMYTYLAIAVVAAAEFPLAYDAVSIETGSYKFTSRQMFLITVVFSFLWGLSVCLFVLVGLYTVIQNVIRKVGKTT